MSVCDCACVSGVCVMMHTPDLMLMSIVFLYDFPSYYFETGFLADPGTCHFGWTEWTSVPHDFPVSTVSSQFRDYRHTWLDLAFYMCTEDRNSSLHA